MGTLKVDHLAKAFGINTLFSQVGFEIKKGDKVGLIGANGSGKSTLLKCIMGLVQPDDGEISLPPDDTVGYVEQDTSLRQGTFYDELLSSYGDVLHWQEEMRHLEKAIADERGAQALDGLMKEYGRVVENFERNGGYEYESMIRKIAYGLGFTEEDFPRALDTFSGGQKTRICLARALIRQPDFLFLDEPTNHLDIGMVEWLEDFLQNYAGGLLIISHDRYFLDKVVGRILEMEGGKLTSYNTDYTGYLVQKAERQEAARSAYEKQQVFIAKTEEFIRRYKAGVKSKQARGREKRLERLERITIPSENASFNYFAFNPLGDCAERVVELQEVTGGYGDKAIFRDTSLLIRKGDGVALIGPNGAGKTTLLKVITGELTAVRGNVKLGSRVKIGYFAQEHEGLTPQNRVLDEIMQEYGLSEERSRSYLGAFLFRGEDVLKIIQDLSGGEKARLAMLKLMLSGANFLILDEPTNHLDIPAKEAVEEAIMAFPGTFLAVSHDRYFLDKVANRVLELADGTLTEYMGNYSCYREKKAADARQAELEAAAVPRGKQEKAGSPAARERRSRQDTERVLGQLEAEIAALESETAGLEKMLNDPANHEDPEQSRELADRYATVQADLAQKYEEWMEKNGEE